MPYDQSLIQSAKRALRSEQKQKEQRQEQLRQRAYAMAPRIQEIDQLLRNTTGDLVKLTLEKAPLEAFDQLKKENLGLQEKKKQLLLSLGIMPDDLVESSHCPLCFDQGRLGGKLCQCLLPYCIQAQLDQLQPLLQGNKHSFENFTLDFYSPHPWMETPTSPQENMKNVLQICLSYAEAFEAYPKKNLLFSGSPGLGKTFLSGCIARRITLKGKSVIYGTADSIFHQFQVRQFRKTHEEEYRSAQGTTQGFLHCDLLVIDDLGSEFTTTVTDASLYEVVNTRLMAGLHTIISTNLAISELYDRYPPQVISRLKGDYILLDFYGKDLRGSKLSKGYH